MYYELNDQMPSSFHLDKDELHIWSVDLIPDDHNLEYYQSLLAFDELEKVRRYEFDKDRYSYMICRANLRLLLAKYLDIAPGKIVFQYNEYGKPSLNEDALNFNVSHSGEVGLIALGYQSHLGVDIERLNSKLDFERLVNNLFSKAEAQVILTLPKTLQTRAFYDCWTRKEAFIKAHGEGLSLPLDQFEVSILKDQAPKLLKMAWSTESIEDWDMIALNPQSGYTGATVVKGNIKKVHFSRLPASLWKG